MQRPPGPPPKFTLPSKPVPQPDPIDAIPKAGEGEEGGRKTGLEPTRYGDWESKGIAVDF